MYYHLRRKITNDNQKLSNQALYEKMVEEYKDVYLVSEEIASYLKEKTGQELDSEEKLYLMLHINRLCSRE